MAPSCFPEEQKLDQSLGCRLFICACLPSNSSGAAAVGVAYVSTVGAYQSGGGLFPQEDHVAWSCRCRDRGGGEPARNWRNAAIWGGGTWESAGWFRSTKGHVGRTSQPFPDQSAVSRPTLHPRSAERDSSEEKAHLRWILLLRLKMDSGERGRRPALEADVIRVVQSVTQSALSPAVCAQSGGGGRKPFHRFRVHVRHPEPHIISAAPQMRAFTG